MLRSREREEIIRFLQGIGAESLEKSSESPQGSAIEGPGLAGDALERRAVEIANASRGLCSLTIVELFQLDVKPREMFLHPFLPVQGLSMLYSQRGVGKTYIGLGIAVAVASGESFLCGVAPQARRVLYVDGEMPVATLRERLASIVSGSNPNCNRKTSASSRPIYRAVACQTSPLSQAKTKSRRISTECGLSF
jgi:AAA domain